MKKIKARVAEVAGCEYCRKEVSAEGRYADISISFLGLTRVLKIYLHSHPICPTQAFEIRYCPFCGRKLI